MIDHIGIPVENHAASRAFYLAALAPLGIGVVMEVSRKESGAASDLTGFGAQGKPFFWITEGRTAGGLHLAFGCRITQRRSMHSMPPP